MKKMLGVVFLLVATVVAAEVQKPDAPEFAIYKDAGSRENHYIPSGWMGSTRSLKMTPNWVAGPHSGKSCIRIDYDVTKDSETTWAGIYWQMPSNNWGNMKGGYDLSNYKKLRFWARGQGTVEKFMVGGITGQTQDGDSGEAYTDRIDLTQDWKQYSIDLKDTDLHHIIGGFGFAASADYNDKGLILMLDDIEYVK